MDVGMIGRGGWMPATGVSTWQVQGASAQDGSGFDVAATAQGTAANGSGSGDAARIAEEKAQAKVMEDQFNKECETCKNRKYQDGSNDPGVSFKSAQHIDPTQSASIVAGHEMEHVAHEQAKAQQEGGEVVNQSVRLHGAFCPDCGRYYVAGGVTETTVRHGAGNEDHGHNGGSEGGDSGLDITA